MKVGPCAAPVIGLTSASHGRERSPTVWKTPARYSLVPAGLMATVLTLRSAFGSNVGSSAPVALSSSAAPCRLTPFIWPNSPTT